MTRGQGKRSGPSARRGSTRRKLVPATQDSHPDVIEWRRIALDTQLPKPRFPAGLRAPSLVCTGALVVLALVLAVYLGLQGGDQVPRAAVDSQERLVRSLARGLNAAVTAGTEQLEEAAEDHAGAAERNAARLLETTAAGRTRWTGLAVIRANTREPVATRGQPIPVDLIPQNVTRATAIPVLNGAGPGAVIVTPLPDGQLLAGATVLQVRQLKLGAVGQQTVLVGLRSGEYTAVQGVGVPKQGRLDRPVGEAIATAADGDVASLTRSVAPPAGWSAPSPPVAVIVAAPVGDLGLAVASTVLVPVVDGGSRWQGAPPAAALIILAGMAYLVVHFGLVRPVRRLLAAAQAAACGDDGPQTPVRRPGEARRIYDVLHPPAGSPRRGGRRALPVVGALVAAALLLLTWPAAVVATLGERAPEVPAQVVVDAENQATSTAVALSEALDRGLSQIQEIASRAGTDAATDRRELQRLNRTERRYRSLYVADQDGSPVLAVGRQPLRRTAPIPNDGGIRLDNTSGRLPVIYAHARGANGRAVVGEFDVEYLSGLLDRVAGRGRVVDSELRTILDTEGYRAFQPLVEGPQRAAAVAAVVGQTRASVVSRGSAGRWLVSVAAVGAPSYVADLGWTVVAEWSVASLDLPPNTQRRGALTMAGIAVAVVLTTFGWHYFVLVRPLRRLVAVAEKLAEGDTDTVISPHRYDEIGAIAACLEICRQVRVYGVQRLGGVVRLRGWADDHTTVLPLVTRQLTAPQRSSRKS